MSFLTAPSKITRVPGVGERTALPVRRTRGARRTACPLLTAFLLAPSLVLGAGAQQTTSVGEPGRIEGTIVDAQSGAPVAAAQVRVRDVGRSDVSHPDGSFHLERVPEGSHQLVVERLGYSTYEEVLEVTAGRTTEVAVRLEASAIALAGIVVTGVGRERGVHETYQATSVLGSEELERRLTNSLAGTIAHEPGISMRSFGPTTAQPVIRGLGGDRVLVLEDGQRTGDMSTTGADHAVGIDPVGANRIEVVRGPAGVLYGSSALGGVINVIREEVPRSAPERVEGSLSVQGESVHDGLTGAAQAMVPVDGRFVLRGEASLRRTGVTRTPLGPVPNTDARGFNGALGASWVPSWGFLGASFREYRLDHGVPGEFGGETIPGAHEGGADTESLRRVGRVEFGHFAGLGPFEAVEAEGNIVHYTHAELERTEDDQRVVGTSFDQLSGTLSMSARHEHEHEAVTQEGAVGLFLLHRDLLTGGRYPGTRDSREWNLAGFIYEEVGFDVFRLQAGARYDWLRIEPTDTRPIDAGETPRPVRTRTFGDFSGSVAALWDVGGGVTLGLSTARAFRTPSVQELYSNGPHLADFAYDIGNPDLGTEVGLGTDAFVRVNRSGLSAEATVFRNAISNFIHYYPTGETDSRFQRFPVFEARGEDAVFLGADTRVQWEVVPGVVLDGTLSWVRAEYQEREEPLPAIPPLNGSLSGRYERGPYFFEVGWDAAARQDRVPDPIETGADETLVPERPTDGYGLMHLGAGYRWRLGSWSHSITLTAENVLDKTWRDHLSRTKEVAPEPGRNVQLLYRIGF